MKNYTSSLILAFIAMALYSCNNKYSDNSIDLQTEFEPIEETLTLTGEILIEDTRVVPSPDSPTKPIKIQVIASFDPSTECVTNYSIEQVEGEIITDLEITQEELDELLIQELGENFTDIPALEANLANAKIEASNENYTLSSCLTDCHRNFTDENGNKIKGRGTCKFSCWFERILIAIEKIFSLSLD